MAEQKQESSETTGNARIMTGTIVSSSFFKMNFKKAGLLTVSLLILAGVVIPVSSHHSAPVLSYDTTEQQVHQFANQGKYNQAQKMLVNQFNETTNKQNKVSYLYLLSTLALQHKDTNSALKYAKQALKIDPSSNNAYAALAQVATAQNNKKLAQKYWRQAILHLNANSPSYDYVKQQYISDLKSVQ